MKTRNSFSILTAFLPVLLVSSFFVSCTIGGAEAGLLGTWRVVSWDQTGITTASGTLHFAASDRYRMDVKLGTTLGVIAKITEKGRVYQPDSINRSFSLDADDGNQTECTYRMVGGQLTIESDIWTIELTR